jgi:hypothetical protein
VSASLPKPKVGWDPVYELLRCLGQVATDPSVRADHSLTLIAGMQAGDPIDEWLLVELLALAGLDVGDPVCQAAIQEHVGDLVGAGVLQVVWGPGSPLQASATGRLRLARGRRERSRHRTHVLEQMRAVEDGLQRALDAMDEASGEDTL